MNTWICVHLFNHSHPGGCQDIIMVFISLVMRCWASFHMWLPFGQTPLWNAVHYFCLFLNWVLSQWSLGVIYILWMHELQISSCSLSLDEQKLLKFSVSTFPCMGGTLVTYLKSLHYSKVMKLCFLLKALEFSFSRCNRPLKSFIHLELMLVSSGK